MNLILQVFVIFAAAKVAGELSVRLGLPAIVGELLVGVVIGPHALGWIELNQATTVLGDLGVVVLLFVAGLETRLSELVSAWKPSALASSLGMLAAGGAGFGIVVAFGYSARAGAVAGVALAASSVGIAARAFSDLGAVASRPARVVFGAAVLDDIVTLVAIPVAIGVGGRRGAGGIAVAVVGALAFVVLVSALGTPFFRRYSRLLERPRLHRAPFVVSLALCLGLAALAEQVGLAALVGAFLAGMALAETSERYELDRRMEPLFDFLVPFFFVLAGAKMDVHALAGTGAWFVVALVLVTIAAKFLGAGLGAVGSPLRDRTIVGAGMIPRGEVTLAVATAGLAAARIPETVFSALVAAVLVTSLVGPPALQAAHPDRQPFRAKRGDSPPEAAGSRSPEDG